MHEQPIGALERSGALYPDRLQRYEPGWVEPGPGVRVVVDRYWHVRWQLDQPVQERIIDAPAVTLTIEDGDVPAPLMITGPSTRAWQRTIGGRGRVFGVRLRPAGLGVVCDLPAEHLVDAALPVTAHVDARLHALLADIAREQTVRARVRAADALLGEALRQRPPGAGQLLANRAIEELRVGLQTRTGQGLPRALGVSERSIQRALAATLGRGPKWVARRTRLQALALALATTDEDLAELASRLGYTDQAHLTRDFRAVAGLTPSQHRRELRTRPG